MSSNFSVLPFLPLLGMDIFIAIVLSLFEHYFRMYLNSYMGVFGGGQWDTNNLSFIHSLQIKRYTIWIFGGSEDSGLKALSFAWMRFLGVPG